MGGAPLIDDGRLRICSHHGRPDKMPARLAHGHADERFDCAGGSHRLETTVDVELQEPMRILIDLVDDLGRRKTVGVDERLR